jgi:hypothetical protein
VEEVAERRRWDPRRVAVSPAVWRSVPNQAGNEVAVAEVAAPARSPAAEAAGEPGRSPGWRAARLVAAKAHEAPRTQGRAGKVEMATEAGPR